MVIGDRYSVLAPLARGGFGTVYEAEQITTERRVALKLVVRQPGLDSTELMLSEARLASRLQSEHIVQVLDAGIDHATGSVFVVMDLLEGSTLGELLEERGRLEPATVVDYVRQICSGLEKAHTHIDRDGKLAPIVHRDLKPANVFVTRRDNGSALLKILDFGTAKMLSARAASSRIVRGTPQYMAPEQLAGDRPTPATDIWSLGLMTFELLTGHSYWLAVARDAPYEALFNELHVLPFVKASQRARELGQSSELGPAFDDWFARCVQRDPEQRFASASLAANELALALSGSSQHATSPLAGPTVGALSGRALSPAPDLRRAHGAFDATTSATWLPQRPRQWRARLLALALVALTAAGAAWFAQRPAETETPKAVESVAPVPPRPSVAEPRPSVAEPSEARSQATAVPPAAPSAVSPGASIASDVKESAELTTTKRAPRPVRARPAKGRAAPEPAPKSSQDEKPNPYQLR
jgi:serine/threonine-protein kinase